MNQSNYKIVAKLINDLNYSQLRKINDKISKLHENRIVANSLEKSRSALCCSHCKSKEFVRWGRQSDLQRYKCKDCKKTFNSLSGTPLAKLRRKGHWLQYAKCLVEGKTIRKSAAICGVAKTTSFRWRHRFLIGTNNLMLDKIKGIIEIDDLKKNKSYKGSRNIPINSQMSREEIFLLFVRDRYGNTLNFIVDKITKESLAKKLNARFEKDNLLCTLNKDIYFEYTKDSNIRHGYINHQKGEKVKKDIVHINNVVNYHEKLFKWMKRFRGVATKYLENYLSWYRGLDEYDLNPSPIVVLRRSVNFY